jgi:hypothetical protein
MTEQWRPVPGYEGLYSVSSLGNVRSEERVVPNGKSQRVVAERILRQRLNSEGYSSVDLCVCCKRTTHRVHRLVAEAFIGPVPVGQCVLHGPRGKGCNTVSNLYYGTLERNNGEDRIRDGTDNRGSRNGNAKLNPDIIRNIRSSRETHAELARRFSVSMTTIYQIRLRQRWSHVN